MCYQGDVEGKRFDDRIFVSDFARLCRIVHKHVFLNLVESGNTVGCCHLKNGYIYCASILSPLGSDRTHYRICTASANKP